jgi:serine/threonine-protein kinase
MNQPELVALPNTENVTTPFFSPDGRWIAFFADGKLKKISIEGGAPLTLCNVGSDPRGGAWGPDDTIVFASAGSSGLFRVPASGGTPEPLTELDATRGETAHRWPEILPDGKTVLFTVMQGGQFDLEAVSLESRERRLLLENASQPAYAASGHLVYAQMSSRASNEPRGTLLAVSFDPVRAEVTGPPVPILESVIVWPGGGTNFVLSRNGTLAYLAGASGGGVPTTLVWVDRQGKEETLPEPPRTYFVPRISPDGSKLALNIIENSNVDVWVYDLKRSTLSRLTFDPLADELTPVWSPDGSRIAFSVEDQRKIMLIPADGSSPAEAIASTEFNTRLSSWSPDGKTLFVTEESSTNDDIKALDLEGEGKLEKFLATETEHFEDQPVISPGGRWVAYISNESGNREVFVQAFPGPGGKWQISSEGGTAPLWSRDGRELFYRNGNRMMVVEVETSDTFRASRPRVLFEGNYLYFRSVRNYDISPDGKRFLMIKALNPQQTTAPTIHFALNWFDELRRRVPTK